LSSPAGSPSAARPGRDLPAGGHRLERPLALLDDVPLSDAEAGYVAAARAANTLRGYRSDWAEWCTWCATNHVDPLPAAPAAITAYLTFLAGAGAGAKVGTIARRLSARRFAHRLQGFPDPTTAPRVVAVWEGIRRTHGPPPDQATPRPHQGTREFRERPARDISERLDPQLGKYLTADKYTDTSLLLSLLSFAEHTIQPL